MTKIVVFSNLRIGIGKRFKSALNESIDTIAKYCQENKIETVVSNGNLFNSSSIDCETAEIFIQLLTRLEDAGVKVLHCNPGRLEVSSRSDKTNNSLVLAWMIGEGAPPHISVVSETTLTGDKLRLFPYYEKVEAGDDETIVHPIEGILFPSSEGIIDFTAPYQQSPAQTETRFLVVDTEAKTVEKVEINSQRLFYTIKLEAGKVDGELGVKWLTANRTKLKEASKIFVVVDFETSGKDLERFSSVLATINNNYEITDAKEPSKLTLAEISGSPILAAVKSFFEDDAESTAIVQSIFEEASACA
jgi:DNA repair exonuclease SbcCD nuclease subunit